MRTVQWILLGALLLGLAVFTFREHFEATQSIKAPPYSDAEKLRIYDMLPPDQETTVLEDFKTTAGKATEVARYTTLKAKTGRTPAEEAELRQLKLQFAGMTSQIVGRFYTEVYARATTPITSATIATFLGTMPSTSPAVRSALESLLSSYFVQGVGTSITSGYAAALRELGQGTGYTAASSAASGSGAGAGGAAGRAGGRAGAGMGSTDTSTPGTAMTSSGSAMAGNTTGGSSTTVFGPTAGGRAGGSGGSTGGAGKYVVWGPIRGDRAEGADGVNPMDSTKSNKYPELLGGLGTGGDKTRIDGVGLAEPSSSWTLSMSGLLPDMSSLGATEASKFLPFSRSPGDMEKIPDPYRVSQTFRTSSYASKTEPVPFLADFSAFQK